MAFLGKSIFIWQISAILGGDVNKIASMLKTAGFQSAILHSENLSTWKTGSRPALVKALKVAGIRVVGSAAVYGAYPLSEGYKAASICNEFGLEAFTFDAESAFDRISNPDTAAVKLIKAFRSDAPKAKVGWCWWAFYQSSSGRTIYHPKKILWAAMHPDYGNADFGMMMAYWSWGDSPISAIAYLQESWRQWREITDKPLIPAGRAYIGDGGIAKPDAIAAFEDCARLLGAEGVAWWSMQHALDDVHLPGVWDALANLQPFADSDAPEPEPQPEPAGLFMQAARFVNIREAPTTSSRDLGDVQPGEKVGPIIGVAGGKTGAWVHLADGRYVCVADTNGNVYLVEMTNAS